MKQPHFFWRDIPKRPSCGTLSVPTRGYLKSSILLELHGDRWNRSCLWWPSYAMLRFSAIAPRLKSWLFALIFFVAGLGPGLRLGRFLSNIEIQATFSQRVGAVYFLSTKDTSRGRRIWLHDLKWWKGWMWDALIDSFFSGTLRSVCTLKMCV